MIWTRSLKLRLIDAYNTVILQTNNRKITKKKMWTLVADMVGIAANHCENRWKVLERNFKAFKDNKRQTGRGRKVFEYAAEMEAVLGHKKTINPPLLLNTETVSAPLVIKETDEDTATPESPKVPKKTHQSEVQCPGGDSQRQETIPR
ncbi:hypothetical protein GE061_000234 [Apolygus lucorum]|uniref:Myb/SANT-like DNA-binding domain-containing protein n=1 Tax=Apolygus lucorum TaxID=248454 RepID=A0A6A4JAV0_APOLU|nr:hypothetical protein GE061_000234 [Apolygus lucorum]